MKHATQRNPPDSRTAASAGGGARKNANVPNKFAADQKAIAGKKRKSRSEVAPRKKATARKRPSLRPKEPTFGDLCEWSGGLAVVWRRKGCTEREMREFVNDDEFVLCDVVPALHALGFTEDDVIRYVPHDGVLAALMLGLSRFMTAQSPYSRGSGILALPPWLLMAFFRRMFTRRIAALRNKAARPAHYEAEKARRQAMAAERRRMSRRTTTSPCPTREVLLEAWRHVRDSKESLVRFGSLMQDLECYVDNSLRFDGHGRIVGRNAGVKGWLRENLPELAEHYCSAIRYKAAAKKLRQIVGLADPMPVAAVLGDSEACYAEEEGARRTGEGDAFNYGAEKLKGGVNSGKGEVPQDGALQPETPRMETPPVEVVRARAIYLEAMEGIPDVAARVMARIDALCDPERTDEAATLRSWRERYVNAITVRRKDSWWRRLIASA